MVTNFEVRLLLVLWDLGGAEIRKGLVNIRFSGKTAVVNTACARLTETGAVKTSPDGRFLTLTDEGKELLASSLGDKFEFEAQIGAKTANALLKWFRINASVQPQSLANASQKAAIFTYGEFQELALASYDQLNSEFNFDRLVPIYRMRQDLGDREGRLGRASKPNIFRVFECLLGFAIAQPNLRIFVVSGVLSVNQPKTSRR